MTPDNDFVHNINSGKSDRSKGFTSDHLLFKSVLLYGYSLHALLLSTIVSIPKDVKSSLSSADNYRRIFLFNLKINLKILSLNSYIYPYLTYCVEVWRSASKCHLNSLFLLQKKIIRIMTFSSFLAHTDPIFEDLAILPLDKIFIDRIAITMFNVEYELLPKSVIQMFSKNRDIHSHDTRDRNLLRAAPGTKNFTYFKN